ncbi:MAG: hypothetical protein ROZ37_06275 [Aromatoleum sp.]|jgi:hypothetical protein|uniref:hypothetical protein n=1 Tax=Aromatoleum sp. TaxID=2307007 RepID=UPI002895E19A|nr:hypothetical protein [Aromatoleum sp.]MDT3669920.1 hypothetical protein [Aromatoleum sp.]
MNHKAVFATVLTILAFSGPAFGECTFNWEHYGPTQTYNRIEKDIGSKVTEQYCNKYNKTHQLVVITDAYVNSSRTLVHVAVALRKRGSKEVPVKRFSAYKFEDGNFVIAKGYEMAASLALDTVMDVMSDLDSYAN